MQKQLFAHYFCRHEAQGRGGNLVFGELRRGNGQFGADKLCQIGQAISFQGRGGEKLRLGPHFAQARQKRQHAAFVREHIDLVDHHNHGPFVTRQGFGQGCEVALQKFGVANIQVGVKHRHGDFGLGKALPHGLKHGFAQPAAHLGKARRIHKDNLGIFVCKNTHNLVARCLRLGRDNSNLLAEQGVEQGGFARIGGPHKRHPTATIVLIRHSFSRLEASSLYRRPCDGILLGNCRARIRKHAKSRPLRANILKKLRFRVRAGTGFALLPGTIRVRLL